MLSDAVSEVIYDLDAGLEQYGPITEEAVGAGHYDFEYSPVILAAVREARDKLEAVRILLDVPPIPGTRPSLWFTGSEADTPPVRAELEALERRLLEANDPWAPTSAER